MLVLTRRKGERLIINDGEIIITIMDVIGCQVRLGIDAPRSIPIHREEVWQKIIEQKAREVCGEK